MRRLPVLVAGLRWRWLADGAQRPGRPDDDLAGAGLRPRRDPERPRGRDGRGAERAGRVDDGALPEPGEHGARARLPPRGARRRTRPRRSGRRYGLAIVDSVINASHLSGGVGGTWNEFDPERDAPRRGPTCAAALALPLGDYLAHRRHGPVAARRPGGVARARSGRAYASDGTSEQPASSTG